MEWTTTTDPSTLSDDELQKRLDYAGEQARIWNRRFLGLLPEAQRRGLPERMGCTSPAEFAAKKGGATWQAVRTVLEADRQLADKPAMRALLVTGTVPAGKLNVAARAATPDTDAVWAKRVRTLTWQGVEELARGSRTQDEVPPQEVEARALGYTPRQPDPPTDLAERVVELPVTLVAGERFLTMRDGFSRQRRRTVSMSESLVILMDGFSGKEPRRCLQVVYADPQGQSFVTPTRWGLVPLTRDEVDARKTTHDPVDLAELKRQAEVAAAETEGRALPEAVRRYVTARFGGFCAFPGCHRRAAVEHHAYRWALKKRHIPDQIAPLCRAHETLAHRGLLAHELQDALSWRLRLERPTDSADEAARARVDARMWERRSGRP